mgnify:CR=1 FL=1
MQIAVASKNPVKVSAARQGFERMFSQQTVETLSANVPSHVSDQPMTDEETRRGAENRVAGIREQIPTADYWVGIEGGIERINDQYQAFAWVVVASSDETASSRSGTFLLPPRVAELIDEGIELGHANDQVFGEHNSKQHLGAVGLLTEGLIDRTALYVHAVQLALIPFKQPALY